MSTFTFRLDARQLAPQFRSALEAEEKNLRRKVLFAMGKEFKAIVIANFATRGGFSPIKWAPLSKRYQQRMARRDQRTPTYVGSSATLFRSGALFRSVKLTMTENSAVISEGDGLSYAGTHQFGYRGVPPRPTFPIDGSFESGLLTAFAEQRLVKAAERALSG